MSNTEVGIEMMRAFLFTIVVHAPLIVEASEPFLLPNAENEQATPGACNESITSKRNRMVCGREPRGWGISMESEPMNL